MTDLKPKRALSDVAEDWANPGVYDTSADFAAIPTTRKRENVVNDHSGSVPAGELKNAADLGERIALGEVPSDNNRNPRA
jgi:hypothetical protein